MEKWKRKKIKKKLHVVKMFVKYYCIDEQICTSMTFASMYYHIRNFLIRNQCSNFSTCFYVLTYNWFIIGAIVQKMWIISCSYILFMFHVTYKIYYVFLMVLYFITLRITFCSQCILLFADSRTCKSLIKPIK